MRAECSQLTPQAGVVECTNGSLSGKGLTERLPLRFTLRGTALELEFRPVAGASWRLQRQGGGTITVQVSGGRVERLQALLAIPADWKVSGLSLRHISRSCLSRSGGDAAG